MSWIRPERKTYRTSDPTEARFLREATNWNVILEEEDTGASQPTRQRTAEEITREAFEQHGADYDAYKRRTEASEKEYVVTSDAELNALANKARKQVAQERTEQNPFELYSKVVRAAYDAERSGHVSKARTGYKAAINFLNGLHNDICKRSLGEDTVAARQMINEKKLAVKGRLANL